MEEPSTSARQLRQGSMERKMSNTACTIINELRLEGKLCDVVIQVNGIEFNAHKNILCSCSPYFRALFTSSWSSREKEVYNIPGMSPDMMKLIIEYAYTRTVPVTVENVERLLPAADQFNVLRIVHACCEFLESQLCLENCIGIYKFADCYFCPDLRHKAYVYILHHFEEMVKVSEEFLELSAFELRDIIKNDKLNVKQEDVVFDAILKWIVQDPNVRKRSIAILLPKVRLALMNAEYFMNNVKNDYVKDNAECKPVIVNALKAMYNPLTRPRLPFSILFAIGGWSGGSPTNAIEAYDARADHWVNVPCEESFHGKVYICGGFNGNECLFAAEFYTLETNQWTTIAPMRSRQSGVGVIAYGECVYAVGGFDGSNRLRSAEACSPLTSTWRTLPTMFNPRSNFGIEVVDDLLFVVGGFNGFTTTFNVECYDEKTDEWYDAHDMSIYRSALSCCVVPGLPNVRKYAAPRDNLLGLLSHEQQIKYSASTNTLAV